MAVEQQKGLPVYYQGIVVEEYVADLVVAHSVLAELKAVKVLDDVHLAQRLNYLKATGLPMCLLLNFGHSRLQIKRVVNQFDRLGSASIGGSFT